MTARNLSVGRGELSAVCSRCGKSCTGDASIHLAGRTDFYCNGRFDRCYQDATAMLAAACASVGIEHGRSTAEMLAEVGYELR